LASRCDDEDEEDGGMLIEMIDNRGLVVWPYKPQPFTKAARIEQKKEAIRLFFSNAKQESSPDIFCSDLFRVRYRCPDDSQKEITHQDIIKLLDCIRFQGLEFVKTELLYNFDGKPGFTRGQGQ